MMAIEYDGRIIVIDAGLMFPKEDMLGVDLVIPDISYLVERASQVQAILLTHGHEDHIGALPFVINRLNVPIYGTRMTLGLVKNKLKEHKLLGNATLHEVKPGDVVNLPPFSIEYIHVAHSIPDATALAITTPVGVILHSGDFKLDQTPVDGRPTDMSRLGEYGQDGVLLFLSDSTNAEMDGHTPSEQVVGEAFRSIFPQAQGRIIITTFASNIYRLQQAMEVAAPVRPQGRGRRPEHVQQHPPGPGAGAPAGAAGHADPGEAAGQAPRRRGGGPQHRRAGRAAVGAVPDRQP